MSSIIKHEEQYGTILATKVYQKMLKGEIYKAYWELAGMAQFEVAAEMRDVVWINLN